MNKHYPAAPKLLQPVYNVSQNMNVPVLLWCTVLTITLRVVTYDIREVYLIVFHAHPYMEGGLVDYSRLAPSPFLRKWAGELFWKCVYELFWGISPCLFSTYNPQNPKFSLLAPSALASHSLTYLSRTRAKQCIYEPVRLTQCLFWGTMTVLLAFRVVLFVDHCPKNQNFLRSYLWSSGGLSLTILSRRRAQEQGIREQLCLLLC